MVIARVMADAVEVVTCESVHILLSKLIRTFSSQPRENTLTPAEVAAVLTSLYGIIVTQQGTLTVSYKCNGEVVVKSYVLVSRIHISEAESEVSTDAIPIVEYPLAEPGDIVSIDSLVTGIRRNIG